MKIWLMHGRSLESFVNDYVVLLDAWESGGVEGLVLGPMIFGAYENQAHSRRMIRLPGSGPLRAAFDPNPDVYASFGVDPPAPPQGDDADLRAGLTKALAALKERGLSLWLIDPFFEAVAPSAEDRVGRICDSDARTALAARMIDTIEAFPMADGFLIDGPNWGFEITEIELRGMERRRLIFDELPATIEPACRALGYDYEAMVAAKDALWQRLHNLDPADVRLHATGGLVGATSLLGGSDLATWFAFRVDALTAFYAQMRQALDERVSRPVRMAVAPRTPALAPLAGYDHRRVAEIADVVMPKLYYWHRGYDGLPGTVYRYVTTLTTWNPTLTVEDACLVTRALLGSAVPVVSDLREFDLLVTPDYLDEIVRLEAGRAIAGVGDRAEVVPWIDSGRAPHDGDPLPATHLQQILTSAEAVGVERFGYFNSTNMTAADWTVLSHQCGQGWNQSESDWRPYDRPTL